MRTSLLIAGILLSCSAAACGSSFQARAGTAFEIDAAKEINDDDVRKAFDARPQLSPKPRIAIYSFDESKGDDVERAVKALPSVGGTYRIPSLLVTGQGRYADNGPPGYAPPRDVSLKKLRLLAARAHADALLVIDRGWRGPGVNWMIGFTALIIPTLFLPFLDDRIDTYAQTFLVDVRNGYLYGDDLVEESTGPSRVTVYAAKGVQGRADAVWPELLAKVSARVDQRIAEASKGAASREGVSAR
jgi:hypothetical protein